jgi:hypothetical protein
MRANLRWVKTVVHWSLLGVTIIYLLTGLGITQYHVIESATFGQLTKSLSFTIHDNLLAPFMIILALHVILTVADSQKRKQR